jgi:hypothetical protein
MGNKWDAIKGATPTHVRNFQDKSGIMYYDNGCITIFRCPLNFEEPYRVPEAELYYWQVIRNRPDISTWEQIKEAENENHS